MTRDEIRAIVLRALGDVAPEADPSRLDPQVPLRDQLDLDSMDILNFMTALHDALGVDVPEPDYGKLGTVASAVDYLERARSRETNDGTT